MEVKASRSEDAGIAALNENDLQIFSVGISTGGVAEIRMAELNPDRHIVASTIDEEGLAFAQKFISERHLDGQIEAKLENVADPLPYPENYFDFVYARLVLHYLPKDELKTSLSGLRRVLKPDGRLFVVVRSTDCPDANREGATFDPDTELTTCYVSDGNAGREYSYSRFFHTKESISGFVEEAGFEVSHVQSYDEQLYKDFMRTELASHTDNVIELLAVKP